MKKIAIVVLSSFIFILSFSSIVFATDPPAPVNDPTQLRVYYSEPLGGGEKVYHITACRKQRSYAPLRCSNAAPVNNYQQCRNAQGQIIEGKIIEGCIQRGQPIAGTSYYVVENEGQRLSCPSEDRAPKYVLEWEVVDASQDLDGDGQGPGDDPDDWLPKGTIAWENEQTIPTQMIRDLLPNGNPLVKARYNTTLCAPWDIRVDPRTDREAPGGDESADTSNTILQNLLRQIEGWSAVVNEAIAAGCNTNIHSTPFESQTSATCTIAYRVTGSSGAEIFGKYISLLYKWAGGFVGIIAVLVMVISGVQISMAGGDTAKIDNAKHRITQSIIGLVLLFLSGLILYTINPGFFTGG